MKFDELSDRAKKRARDEYRRHNQDHDWWDSVYEDAVHIGALMGLMIGKTYGKKHDTTDIWFSGFHTQGSGACWDGFVETSMLAGAVERIKAEAPQDAELHELAALAEQLHAEITAEEVKNRLTDDETNRDWPDVEVGMRFNVESDDQHYCTRIDSSVLPDYIEKTANELVDDFASWIYRRLEAEDEYLNSDVCIDESLKANDYDFDEDGNF